MASRPPTSENRDFTPDSKSRNFVGNAKKKKEQSGAKRKEMACCFDSEGCMRFHDPDVDLQLREARPFLRNSEKKSMIIDDLNHGYY